MKPAWRLYYADGSTFDSTQGGPPEAPAFGVQAVVQDCPDEGKHVLTQADYYWREGDRWSGGDFVGLLDFLSRRVGVVRFGRYMAPKDFEAVLARANADPDFVGGGAHRAESAAGPHPGG